MVIKNVSCILVILYCTDNTGWSAAKGVFDDSFKVAGYLSPTHCEYHYKLRRGWGSRYYTIHGNGEDRVQNFRTKFLILCRELCLLTSTYLKINNLRRD